MSDDQEPGTSLWSLPRPLSQDWGAGDETPGAGTEQQVRSRVCCSPARELGGQAGTGGSAVAALEGEGGQQSCAAERTTGMEQKPSGCGDEDAADSFRLGLTQQG